MEIEVKRFIENAKKLKRATFEQERDEHLKYLGLIRTQREFSDYQSSTFPYYDKDAQKYYRDYYVAVEVTDEEYEEIKRLAPPLPEKVNETTRKTTENANKTKSSKGVAETYLGVINGVSFAIGIIATLVLIIVSIVEGEGWLSLIALVVFFLSVTSWSIPRIILNISNNIREINSKLK